MIDVLSSEKPKTKVMAGLFSKLPCKSKTSLLVLASMDKNVILSSRNIEKVSTMQAKDLNALDAASFTYLVMPKNAIPVIQKTFVK